MSRRRETFAFAFALAALLALLLNEGLRPGHVLSSADVLFATKGFAEVEGDGYVPKNRLLIDPVLQFQPWLAFNRDAIRAGKLPLWNPFAGCGTPHLANAQSAPFDPFHAIAYLGKLPDALVWMAFARLWVAGFGMFLLAKRWKFGPWGRWFSGFCFPLSGFLIVWLAFPVTSAAVWLPWLFLTVDRALESPGARSVGLLAVVVGATILAGHIQTSAHVLLAGGFYGLWKLSQIGRAVRWRALRSGLAGVLLGLGIGAITIVPLWSYLGKSRVWESRHDEFRSPWVIDQPRWLDTVCTAVPYLYGSQRREHPNLAKGLGVYNLNESAGGYAGLATLLWLAPQAFFARRTVSAVNFLGPLALFGGLAAFRFTPFSNVMRLLPILDVTDHRRLTLWVAFGLSGLGGVGLDHLDCLWPRRWFAGWVLALATGSVAATGLALAVSNSSDRLYSRSLAHYRSLNVEDFEERAALQVRKVVTFIPRQAGIAAFELLGIACLANLARSKRLSLRSTRSCVVLATVGELLWFGIGMNPAIAASEQLPKTALIEALEKQVGHRGRILGIGEELPPNTLMRYGLADIRNYDSIELQANLDAFPRLFQKEARATTSRNTITWQNVVDSKVDLENAGVIAVVGSTRPPDALIGRKLGHAWIVAIQGKPLIEADSETTRFEVKRGLFDDSIQIEIRSPDKDAIVVRSTYDDGWHAALDGVAVRIDRFQGHFMQISIPKGTHELILNYWPDSVAWGLTISLASLAISLSCLTVRADFLAFGAWTARRRPGRIVS